jgi:hypothetical protein
MLKALEPLGLYRALVFCLFAAYGLYEIVGLVAWYQSLPRLARKIVCLKLLSLRASRLWRELAAVGFLGALAAILIYSQWRWV